MQRSTPSPQLHAEPSPSDSELDDTYLQPGARTPARGTGGTASTLETVQEASPLGAPLGLDSALEKLEDSITSDAGSQPDTAELPATKTFWSRAALAPNESGSDSGSAKADRRSGVTSAPPTLTSRQSSTSTKLNGAGKAKPSEGPLQSVTVETETVTSIPQVSVAPTAVQVINGSLRANPSSETIRPKKEKKKTSRKQTAVAPGNGELLSSAFTPRLRHYQSFRSVSSRTDSCASPTKSCGQGPHADGVASPQRYYSPGARNQSFSLYQMNTILTRYRTASSKADVFEAKVASAVDEADTSDSDETFVYDSNPPDGRDRPQRFHSRTPSATSMVSQVDRTGMRSIHQVLDGPVSGIAVKKNMKFVNNFSSGNDSGLGDDEGKGSSRSNNGGSARGTTRQQNHFARFGRTTPRDAHPSLFDTESPFPLATARPKLGGNNTSSRQTSGPPSPRFSSGRGVANGRRGVLASADYDLDDTTGADDERTPLILSAARIGRTSRNRRHPVSLRSLEQQSYRRQPPSLLNRLATCLVVTVMVMLAISAAIGFMFATSQPLEQIDLLNITNVIASEQELMFDMIIRAHNPNIVVVTVDAADMEAFAKSPHAGTDSEWWRRPHEDGTFAALENRPDEPKNDTSPNMLLGHILEFDSPLSFESSFFHNGRSSSTAGVRIRRPGNETDGGSERWERIMEDEFTLIVKGSLKYSLPLSHRLRSALISGKTRVKPNSANEPPARPPPSNGTVWTS